VARVPASLTTALLAATALAGCGGEAFPDLDRFMAEKRAGGGVAMEPVPPFQAYEAFSYGATTLRSPFDRPVEIREVGRPRSVSTVRPDESRPEEFLERFTFDSLTMVGSLSRAGTAWSLIRDPDGGVHRVKPGDYLGRDHGRIVEITETRVAVVEIVSDGDEGWVERPRTIELQDAR